MTSLLLRFSYLGAGSEKFIRLSVLTKRFYSVTVPKMGKPKVFMTRNDYPSVAVDILKEKFDLIVWDSSSSGISKDQLMEQVKGVYAIFCLPATKIDKDVINSAGSNLKVVSTMSVGYDHLDIDELRARQIRIGYTPDVLTEAVGELALSLTLAAGRRILESYNTVISGTWGKGWTPLWMCGHGLHKATVGIVGLGRIGINIAKKLKVFGIEKLLYTSRKEKQEGKDLNGIWMQIDEMIPLCDYIILTVALTPQTEKIINSERLSKMKPTAILVNIGRGGLIDQDALVDALQRKQIGGVGLDVTTPEPLPKDHPLLTFENAVITPHIGSATYESRYAMAEVAAKNILAVYENEPMVAEL